MKYMSKVHGEITYEDKDIITFKKGVLGFDQLRKFFLVDLKDTEPFKLLHSLEDEEIGFIVTSPYEFFDDYEINLNNEAINNLNIQSSQEVMILTTITLNSDIKKDND